MSSAAYDALPSTYPAISSTGTSAMRPGIDCSLGGRKPANRYPSDQPGTATFVQMNARLDEALIAS